MGGGEGDGPAGSQIRGVRAVPVPGGDGGEDGDTEGVADLPGGGGQGRCDAGLAGGQAVDGGVGDRRVRISVRTCTISRPGMEDGRCWISVRLSVLASASRGGGELVGGSVMRVSLNWTGAPMLGQRGSGSSGKCGLTLLILVTHPADHGCR